MRARRSPPPLGFSCCVAVALAVVVRLVLHVSPALTATDGHAPPVLFAFWSFIIPIITWVWNAIQGAGTLTLEVLAWAVKVLQAGAATLANAVKDGANALRLGFVKAWDFLGSLYDEVLKPAWQKFWNWFDRLRRWLNDTFGPVLQWLRDLRATLLDFWKTYIRPWLDLIDVTRKLLRTLASLGLTWARALDQRLGAIEDAIEAPFRFVLGKLNEIINIVNNVITLDGLIQRVALMRSLARDYEYAWRAITAPYVVPGAGLAPGSIGSATTVKTVDQIADDVRAYLTDEGGALAGIVDEAAAQARIYLRS